MLLFPNGSLRNRHSVTLSKAYFLLGAAVALAAVVAVVVVVVVVVAVVAVVAVVVVVVEITVNAPGCWCSAVPCRQKRHEKF